jgi:5-hydroxyisourate hydrolase
MPGVSVHVVDVASGQVATGLEGAVWDVQSGEGIEIARGRIGPTGLLTADRLDRTFAPGVYEVRLDVGGYYQMSSRDAFLGDVRFRFLVASPETHIHLPFKITAFGFSCFRGA